MHVHNFHCEMVNAENILLILVRIIVHQFMLIIGNNIKVLGERPTDGLDDTTITTEDKYSVKNTKSKKNCLKSALQCK